MCVSLRGRIAVWSKNETKMSDLRATDRLLQGLRPPTRLKLSKDLNETCLSERRNDGVGFRSTAEAGGTVQDTQCLSGKGK